MLDNSFGTFGSAYNWWSLHWSFKVSKYIYLYNQSEVEIPLPYQPNQPQKVDVDAPFTSYVSLGTVKITDTNQIHKVLGASLQESCEWEASNDRENLRSLVRLTFKNGRSRRSSSRRPIHSLEDGVASSGRWGRCFQYRRQKWFVEWCDLQTQTQDENGWWQPRVPRDVLCVKKKVSIFVKFSLKLFTSFLLSWNVADPNLIQFQWLGLLSRIRLQLWLHLRFSKNFNGWVDLLLVF